MKKNIYRFFIELTNSKVLSCLLMRFAKSKSSKVIIPFYSKVYQLNWEEVERDNLDFRSLHELFIRKLKDGSRPICEDKLAVVSPVDAIVEDYGVISTEGTITVKGKSYSMEEMLGDEKVLQKYLDGQYLILYLSPSHYHRIHSPIQCEVMNRWTLGERSYPVNKMGLKYGKAPLSKNFRVITELKHQRGVIALVKVGAMFVNSIEMTNKKEKQEKGEEIAYFSFGSTVVLLFEKGTFRVAEDVKLGNEIKYGERLGYIVD